MKFFDNQVFFLGHKDLFSNMYRCDLMVGEQLFYSAEHLYVYMKALQFNDARVMNICLTNMNPFEVKAASRTINNFDNSLWNEIKLDIMVVIHLIKFCTGPLKEIILASADVELIEGSKDLEWGCGYHIDAINDALKTYPGRNLCGISLMRAREIIKDGQQIDPVSIFEMIC